MDSKIKVGIVGVSGYGGGELVEILAGHPHAELTYVTSGTYKGKPLSAALPGVASRIELTCEEFDQDAAASQCDLLFLAGEAGLAMKVAPGLISAGKKVIDLSADFRLQNVENYAQWYKAGHTAVDWLKTAVYGLPELNRKAIRGANLVANPGCYPTSAILALMPLLKGSLIDRKSIIIDSYSGVSGAGRSKFGLDYHFSEVNESLKPYGVAGAHRHTPEIEQALSQVAGEDIIVSFTPHLAPITRGILTTAYANLLPPLVSKERDGVGFSTEELHKIYADFYKDEPFVHVLAAGSLPATKQTVGSNYCYIGVAVDSRTNRAIVMSAEDNLVKGMAGQAVQNMNLMCGFDETAGLTMAAMWP